jgi:hypothetical protein
MARMRTVQMTQAEYEAFTVQQKAVVLEALEEGLQRARTMRQVLKAVEEALPTMRTIVKLDAKAKKPPYLFKRS